MLHFKVALIAMGLLAAMAMVSYTVEASYYLFLKYTSSEIDKDTKHCLPLVYLAGVNKCGSTDLYRSIIKHPAFVEAERKELLYWNRLRYYG